MAKQAQYQQLKEQGPNASIIVNNPLVGALRQQMVVEQAKVSAMGKIYLSGHPEMQAETAKLAALKSRVDAEVRRLQDSVKADYEAAERTENLLKNSFENQKQQMVNLQDNLSNYQILKRDAQTSEQLYQALLARVKEVNISSTMVSSNVSVIDPAPLPGSPFSPKKFQNMALATLLGLVLGVVLALLVESLDDTIKSTEDLEKTCNLPLLGTLPSLSKYHKLTLSRPTKWDFYRQRLLSHFSRGPAGGAGRGGFGSGGLQAPPGPPHRGPAPHGNLHHAGGFGSAPRGNHGHQPQPLRRQDHGGLQSGSVFGLA